MFISRGAPTQTVLLGTTSIFLREGALGYDITPCILPPFLFVSYVSSILSFYRCSSSFFPFPFGRGCFCFPVVAVWRGLSR